MIAANTLSSEPGEIWSERCFDLLRGAAVLTGNDVLLRLARTVSRFPDAELHVAFNHRQVASKVWARDELVRHGPAERARIWIVGGWYGVLSALLFADDRLSISNIESFDIDPAVAAVAESLNEPQVADGRFAARTADMYSLDYSVASAGPDLVINTSCEHIADLPGWLALIPRGTRVLLQSNDYFAESQHVNSQVSLNDFAAVAGLSQVDFAGSLYLRKYTRFMLIGRV
ncbi:MAG: class I SAM-dependent methyltransferase [Hyphomicrobiales bacterium]